MATRHVRKRNRPCRCGSGRPYKECHRDEDQAREAHERAAAEPRETCRELVDSAQRFREEGKEDRALELAAEVLNKGHLCVSWEPAAHLVVDVLLQRGRLSRAGELSADLVKYNPQCAYGWFQVGLVCEAAGRSEEAIAAFERSIGLHQAAGGGGEPFSGHLHLTRVAIEADRLDLLEPFLRRWEITPPEDPIARLNWAICLMEVGRFDQAEQNLHDLLGAATGIDRVPGLHELGMLALARGEAATAVAYFYEAAEAAHPGDAHQSRAMLAVAEHQRGNGEQALQWARLALAAVPGNVGYRANFAAILASCGQFDDSIAEYRKILSDAPKNRKARFSLGFALFRARRVNEAIGELLRLERSGWIFPPLSPNLGVMLLERRNPGDLEDALARHKRALQLDWSPRNEAILVINTVHILAMAGNVTEALEFARDRGRDWPNEEQLELARIVAHLRQGDRERTIQSVLRTFGEEALASMLQAGGHVQRVGEEPWHSGQPDAKAFRAKKAAERISAAVTEETDIAGPPRESSTKAAGEVDAFGADEVDIAIVTVLPEEYAAVHSRLTRPTLFQGAGKPAPYAWTLGEIPLADGRGAYRVVLAMAARPGNVEASQMTVRTVERWKPACVVLTGIAGGLGREACRKGDVIISRTIFGYEYGKLAARFEPRPENIYQVSGALLSSALATAAVGGDWRNGLPAAPLPTIPSVRDGVVASGEKVVDNRSHELFARVLEVFPKLDAVEMEGAGAASAIAALHGEYSVNFIMVRGISDRPAEAPLDEQSPAGHQTATTVVSAQSAERNAWKVFAAESAAAFVVHWIAQGWPASPKGKGRRVEMGTLPSSTSAVLATAPSDALNEGRDLLGTVFRILSNDGTYPKAHEFRLRFEKRRSSIDALVGAGFLKVGNHGYYVLSLAGLRALDENVVADDLLGCNSILGLLKARYPVTESGHMWTVDDIVALTNDDGRAAVARRLTFLAELPIWSTRAYSPTTGLLSTFQLSEAVLDASFFGP
jgi:tetratricopeptide (TPR) repeat protein/nucleoside phosphorylase